MLKVIKMITPCVSSAEVPGFLRYPFTIRVGAFLLAVLSLVAALPFNPQGPSDARDGSMPPGMRLEFPLSSAIWEPVTAPLHLLAGAPDFRKTRNSLLIWVIAAGATAGFLGRVKSGTRCSFASKIGRAAASAVAVLAFFVLWIATAVMLRLPGWRLVLDDPNALVADLHSHTCGSRDGLVTWQQSLACQAAAGCHVVAITEHGYPAGAYAAQRHALSHPGVPSVIVGEEFSFNRGGAFFVALGLKSSYLYPTGLSRKDFVSRFSAYLHEAQQGALIGMGFKVDESEIQMLMDANADGFEIANFAHPALPASIRERMLGEARKRGLSLVASSDWHGWGGIWRTWTVILGTSAAQATPEQRADLVVQKLRERGTTDVIPVTAGFMGPPPLWRVIFAPVAEFLRYAAELSLPRVIAWWVWGAGALALYSWLSGKYHRPGILLGAGCLTIMGAVMFWAAASLLSLPPEGFIVSAFPQRIGTYCAVLSILAWLLSAWLFRVGLTDARKVSQAAGQSELRPIDHPALAVFLPDKSGGVTGSGELHGG